MEILIKEKRLLNNMGPTTVDNLVERIAELLGAAISVMHEKGRGIELYYNGLNEDFYEVDSRGIARRWRGYLPNGTPITRLAPVSSEEFLQWLSRQPDDVKETVRNNLETYIKTETPKERGEIEFPEPQHAFGY